MVEVSRAARSAARAKAAAQQARKQVQALKEGQSAQGTQPRLASSGSGFLPTAQPAHQAAGAQRILRFWDPYVGAGNQIAAADGPRLRNRARDQERNIGWIVSALDSLEANIIGTGMKPSWRLEDQGKKRELQDLWADWVDEADADGTFDFYGMQRMLVRSVLRDGEALVRLRRRRPEDGLSVPLQLQMLEADHLPFERDLPPNTRGREVRQGIEIDRRGRRRAYHLYRTHPGDAAVFGRFNADDIAVVPADQVIHLRAPQRVGQLRSVSKLHPMLVRMWLLSEFDKHELVRQWSSSTIAGFLKGSTNPLSADEEETEFTFEPGTFQKLDPYEDITFPQLPQPTAYDRFVPTHLRASSAALGTTYEQVTGDLTDVNYSSIRAGLVEMRRRWQVWQGMVRFQLCRAVMREWLTQAVLSGAIELQDFATNQKRYHRVEWIPQGHDWVDPDSEVKAALEGIRGGIDSRDRVVRQRTGRDPAELDEEIAAGNKRLDEKKLRFSTDVRGGGGEGEGEAGASRRSRMQEEEREQEQGRRQGRREQRRGA